MRGHIADHTSSGIDNSKVILVFVTKRYSDKVCGQDRADNCKMEFNYAVQRKSQRYMIPIVMESAMNKPRDWRGALGLALGGDLAIRMSFEFNSANGEKFIDQILRVKQQIDIHLRELNVKQPSRTLTLEQLKPLIISSPPLSRERTKSEPTELTQSGTNPSLNERKSLSLTHDDARRLSRSLSLRPISPKNNGEKKKSRAKSLPSKNRPSVVRRLRRAASKLWFVKWRKSKSTDEQPSSSIDKKGENT